LVFTSHAVPGPHVTPPHVPTDPTPTLVPLAAPLPEGPKPASNPAFGIAFESAFEPERSGEPQPEATSASKNTKSTSARPAQRKRESSSGERGAVCMVFSPSSGGAPNRVGF
jgi:hypothetical protein